MEKIAVARSTTNTKIERARIIRGVVMAHSSTHGRWKTFDLGEGRTARVWSIQPSPDWSADVSTRFSLSSRPPIDVEGYDEALLLQLAPPRSDDVVLDLWVEPAGKVLSLGTSEGVDTLITMQPGPWEEMFGLERRPWTASTAKRLDAREARRGAR